MVHAGDHVKQCGFARAGFSHDAEELALIHTQIDSIQRAEITCCGGIDFRHIFYFDERSNNSGHSNPVKKAAQPAAAEKTSLKHLDCTAAHSLLQSSRLSVSYQHPHFVP